MAKTEWTRELQDDLATYLAGFVSAERLARIDQVLAARTRFLTVVLENLYQPHNASAVLRSCDGFGVQDVHVIENSNRFRLASGITIGADQWLTLRRYSVPDAPNTETCFRDLKARGYRIIAAAPPGVKRESVPFSRLPLDQPTAIVLGAEKAGLSPEVLAGADGFAFIPMSGMSESFNVSVAAALVLYELTERLRAEGRPWRLGAEEFLDLRVQYLRASVREPDILVRDFLARRGR